MNKYSLLQWERLNHIPAVPKILQDPHLITAVPDGQPSKTKRPEITELFPFTSQLPPLAFIKKEGQTHRPLRIGVVFSGGQASGGHNVIWGLLSALKSLHPHSALFGFCDGPVGILNQSYVEITNDSIKPYRNQGGFDLIGSGRDKIATNEQLQLAEQTMNVLHLDGLVIIGGDDSNTNAAILSEYFKKHKCPTSVIGVPKTIDGDLKNGDIEISFGFDTAAKVYCEIIGNLARDALSAKKCYFFVKLMGRSASHLVLECALQTHVNMALISEEVEAKQLSLQQIVDSICDMIIQRSAKGKNYGVVLIPEGLIEFIPEMNQLIRELNQCYAEQVLLEQIEQKLTQESKRCFKSLPEKIQKQLLLIRDPHGNLQVSKIETERLLIEMVEKELASRKFSKFSPQPFFCGYEGRSGLPSLFDSQYCYALGNTAAVLLQSGVSGYISCIKNLAKPVETWEPCGIPLTSMLKLEYRNGSYKPVIEKALVDLKGATFAEFEALREEWLLADDYLYPGPIQFFGPEVLTNSITRTLFLGMNA